MVRAEVLTSQLSRTVELGENIQTAPLSALTSLHRCCCHHRCSVHPALYQHRVLGLRQAGAQLELPPGVPSSSALSSLLSLGNRNHWVRKG